MINSVSVLLVSAALTASWLQMLKTWSWSLSWGRSCSLCWRLTRLMRMLNSMSSIRCIFWCPWLQYTISHECTPWFIKSGPLCIFAITFSNVDRFEWKLHHCIRWEICFQAMCNHTRLKSFATLQLLYQMRWSSLSHSSDIRRRSSSTSLLLDL